MLPQQCYPIPPLGEALWQEGEEARLYAHACLRAVGLSDWNVLPSRAVKQLGCCRASRKEISLSLHFIFYCLGRGHEGMEEIQRLILHEIAHALAYVHHRELGHGQTWRHYCNCLGIAGEKASTRHGNYLESVTSKGQAQYALIHSETGEVIRYFQHAPKKPASYWKNCYVPKRKKETLGKLKLVQLDKAR